MATIAQIEANRRNARRSTGPKSPEGKKIARLNATRHGLLANESVLPHESIPDFENLLTAFRDEYHPATPTEDFLVHQMADAHWRLRRVRRIETGMFDALLEEAEAHNMPEICRTIVDDPPILEPGQQAVRDHDRGTAILGRAFLRHPDRVAVLSRYENNIRRQFHKSLEELRRLRTRPIPGRSHDPRSTLHDPNNSCDSSHDPRSTLHDPNNSCETNPIPPQPLAKQSLCDQPILSAQTPPAPLPCSIDSPLRPSGPPSARNTTGSNI